MAWINLNATDPAPPAGSQNVHFRTDSAHLGTEADPLPTSAYLDPFGGDLGAGGDSGLVPAPAAGDAAANKYLHAGGSFQQILLIVVECKVGDGSVGEIDDIGRASRPGLVSECVVTVNDSDPAVDLTFDIKRNGGSVFSVLPTVAAGTVRGSTFTFGLSASTIAIAKGDLFKITITSGSSSWSFTAQLE